MASSSGAAKKTAAKKSTTKKATAKKSTAKKASEPKGQPVATNSGYQVVPKKFEVQADEATAEMERKRLASDKDYQAQLAQSKREEEARYNQDAENLRKQDATLSNAAEKLGDQDGQKNPVAATPEQIQVQREDEAEKIDASVGGSVPSEGSSSPESRGEVNPSTDEAKKS